MKNLIEINNYNGESTADYDRVVYDATNDKVWFDLFTPSLYEWVDLGLPSGLQWASCNVGATKPEEYGLYFQWGDAQGYSAEDVANGVKSFSWSTYKYCNGSSSTLTKYCNDESYGADGFTDSLTTLETTDDAAYQTNNICRMPTSAEFQDLVDNTTSAWTSVSGVTGLKLTSKIEGYTDKSVFFPAAGYVSNGSLYSTSSYVYVWSSSLSTSYSYYAFYLRAYSGGVRPADNNLRYGGHSVRPVLPKR